MSSVFGQPCAFSSDISAVIGEEMTGNRGRLGASSKRELAVNPWAAGQVFVVGLGVAVKCLLEKQNKSMNTKFRIDMASIVLLP